MKYVYISVLVLCGFLFNSIHVQASEGSLTGDIDAEVKTLDDIFDYGPYNWKVFPVGAKKKGAARLARYNAESHVLDDFLSIYKKLFTQDELKDLWYKVRIDILLKSVGVEWPTCKQYKLFYAYYDAMPSYLKDYRLIKHMKDVLDGQESYYANPDHCEELASRGA